MRKSFVVFFSFLVFFSCQHNDYSPEENLLNFFKNEVVVLNQYQKGSYVDYMRFQNQTYKSKRKIANQLIEEINRRFEEMDPQEKIAYQKKWQKKFQPVIDEIYKKTKNLVAWETKQLTPENMAKIKELSIERKTMEEAMAEKKLKPLFFELPEV